jgi:quinoprotein glucose dehydrogenase
MTFLLRRASCLLLMAMICGIGLFELSAQEILPDGTEAARRAIAGIRVPDGMRMEVFAAEPQVSSPVAICLDEKGRVYAAEEYRFNRGTPENRSQAFLLEDDLQVDSLEGRLAMYRKFEDRFDGGMEWFTRVSDQVRLLEDRDGDGRADVSTIFAGGFNGTLDGLAAGVIARDGDVYLTNIPNLWLLRDTDGDGQADVRKPLHRGFGVNAGFFGHDLHGLVWGPDGRLYFSIGDRGFNITTPEGRHLYGPRRGAVFRCEPDGANLEVVHVGLRNPQELAFDEFGNLFAADNNCDKGDLSRLVYVVPGGDSGWNMAYQSIPEPYLTGPWHAEKLWHVNAPDQPAWIVPPVGALGAGPSGFTYYPGIGLDERYDGHFFMCNYTGRGGIESFAVKQHRAAFQIVDAHDFLKPIQATDADFGYDGKMYVADFVNLDWSGKSLGGRIYTLFDERRVASPAVASVRTLFSEGFQGRPINELVALLGHPDMRVRQRAQAEMARRPDESFSALSGLVSKPVAATDHARSRRRRHALWAVGQIVRATDPQSNHRRDGVAVVRQLLSDDDAELRTQALRVLADVKDRSATAVVVAKLTDESLRVRLDAALALAEIGDSSAIVSVLAMLKENADQDAYLRHGGVMALSKLASDAELVALAGDADASVRLAVLLALRRRNSAEVARFLHDPELRLVTEAARAINDLPLEELNGRLAELTDRIAADASQAPEPFTRRVINACFRAGTTASVEALVRLATLDGLSPTMRSEAVACLAAWSTPPTRDRVTGFWRPLNREPGTDIIKPVIQARAARLLAINNGTLLPLILKLLEQYEISVDDDAIAAWASDETRPVSTRIASLNLLSSRKSTRVASLIEQFQQSKNPPLRATAWRLLSSSNPNAAIAAILAAFSNEDSDIVELQAGLALLGQIAKKPTPALTDDSRQNLERFLIDTLKSLTAVPQSQPKSQTARLAALELDLLEAASVVGSSTGSSTGVSAEIGQLHASYVEQVRNRTETDPLAEFRLALHGGDATLGESIFRGHRKAQCLRCHKIRGNGGDAGPDLTLVADRAKHDREYLLESLIDPHARIAKGFGTVSLLLLSGKEVTGTLIEETSETITLRTPTGSIVAVSPANIDERTKPQSPMPSVREVLSKRELRDLVEFLATLSEWVSRKSVDR